MNRVLATNLYKALKEIKQTQIHKTLPVLNYAKLEFTDGELVITSTNLEEFKVSKCPAIMNDEWSTCVLMVNNYTWWEPRLYSWSKEHHCKGYPFLEFVKLHAEYEDVLELTFNPNIQILTVKVQGERSVTEFKCLDAQEFPPTPEDDDIPASFSTHQYHDIG